MRYGASEERQGPVADICFTPIGERGPILEVERAGGHIQRHTICDFGKPKILDHPILYGFFTTRLTPVACQRPARAGMFSEVSCSLAVALNVFRPSRWFGLFA